MLSEIIKKRCPRCKRRKALENFWRHQNYCKSCSVIRHREWSQRYPDKDRAITQRRLYGVEPEQVEQVRRAQRGRCAICKRRARLCIDHCHKSKVLRGLLCSPCNVGLGMFQDSSELLLGAAKYLQQ